MANADLKLTDLTNSTSVQNGKSDGTGVFDLLMNTINLYLSDQFNAGRLTATEYAQTLFRAIEVVLSESSKIYLSEQLTEAQIDSARKDAEIKELQRIITNIEVLEKELALESDYPVSVTVNYTTGEVASSNIPNKVGLVERKMIVAELTAKLSKLSSALK